MKTHLQQKACFAAKLALRLAIALLMPGLAFPAFAALGGSVDSVQNDQVQLKANLKVRSAEACTIHELTTPTGTVVREYVSAAGQVFGVSWQGPFVPDMRQLLGNYFEQYSRAARVQREHRVGRLPLNIQESGLVVQTAGHMRAYSGRAFDPALLPSGVSASDIQ